MRRLSWCDRRSWIARRSSSKGIQLAEEAFDFVVASCRSAGSRAGRNPAGRSRKTRRAISSRHARSESSKSMPIQPVRCSGSSGVLTRSPRSSAISAIIVVRRTLCSRMRATPICAISLVAGLRDDVAGNRRRSVAEAIHRVGVVDRRVFKIEWPRVRHPAGHGRTELLAQRGLDVDPAAAGTAAAATCASRR